MMFDASVSEVIQQSTANDRKENNTDCFKNSGFAHILQ